MSRWSRRAFLQTMLGSAALAGCQSWRLPGRDSPRVVVVGGGFAGATCARYLKKLDSAIQVTLVEPKSHYLTCPGSNWLLAGLADWSQLRVDYSPLLYQSGIEWVKDQAMTIDRPARQVQLANGQPLSYDRLVLAPGIDFHWDGLQGYSTASVERFPHAWQAGVQTDLLAKQLQAMPDGGVVLMTVPADPYRCPPGPYERASLMAWWLKQHKPRSKVLILDAKRSFSKQALFEQGWRQHFGYQTDHALIEWHSLADNPLQTLDSNTQTLMSDFGDRFRGDVLNIIPPQRAGQLAQTQGLTDSNGWCPVEAYTAHSRFDEHIHIIGDAAQLAPVPKSAFAANSEAKACALAIVALLHEQSPPTAQWMNTCYSLITPEHGISVAGAYQAQAGQMPALVAGSGGVSTRLDAQSLALEAVYARAAYRNLCADSFGL